MSKLNGACGAVSAEAAMSDPPPTPQAMKPETADFVETQRLDFEGWRAMRCSGSVKGRHCTLLARFADTTSDRSALRTRWCSIQPSEEGRSAGAAFTRGKLPASGEQPALAAAPFGATIAPRQYGS
jgi:hypothetical protein